MKSLLKMIAALRAKWREERRMAQVYRAAQDDAKIIVGVLHNWLWDFDKAIKFMTPNGAARVGDVAFVPYKLARRRDFVVVLNTPIERRITVEVAPERLWFGSGEPPDPAFAPYQEGQGPQSTVIAPVSDRPEPATGRNFIAAPPVLRSWMVERTAEQLRAMSHIEKTRGLSWVTSAKSDLPGHKRRLAFLDRLRREVSFDLYGNGFQRLADKWDGIAPYRYSIAFENTLAPLYFTEKLMDCFVCHTLPLYYGASGVDRFFPSQAFIRIDPEDPQVFDKIRDMLDSGLWQERLPYLLEAKEIVLGRLNSFNRLAAYLKEANLKPPQPAARILLRHQKALPH